ncbi:MAG: phosphoenolpyruvate--protein phosphotransferase [Holosporales bacterium]
MITPRSLHDVPFDAQHHLLRRLRELMGGASLTAHQRLQKLTEVTAASLNVDVCAVFVLRAGVVLELFGAYGLNPESIHHTRLRVGEGVVGDVAANSRPLILANASAHPNFAPRPETLEGNYHGFAGVPILRGGRVLGVLIVQTLEKRLLSEDIVDVLQTIGMLLAEMIGGGELIHKDEILPLEGTDSCAVKLKGVSLNGGLAKGHAILHSPRVAVRQLVADNIDQEVGRFEAAVASMQAEVARLLDLPYLVLGEGHLVLETYQMFARDKGWLERMRRAIRRGLTAEAAVEKIQGELRAQVLQQRNLILRERLTDFEDLANRLLRHLTGQAGPMTLDAFAPEGIVLIAKSLGPAELLDYQHLSVKALVLEEGLHTAHVAIVARALDIPVVARVPEALTRIEPGDVVMVDGDRAEIIVRPGGVAFHDFVSRKRRWRDRQEKIKEALNHPPTARCGQTLKIYLNAGLPQDLALLSHPHIQGIGLYRTEIPFMVRESYPGVNEQRQLYQGIFEQSQSKPVHFRTLDVGSDKILSYFATRVEENPALGWRAVRMGLDQPQLLRQQLRALLQAAQGRVLHVLFPMITSLEEYFQAKNLLQRECEFMKERQEMPSEVRIGVMIEVPSLVEELEILSREVDFLCLGTNDLQQFFFAADRGSPRVAGRYDCLSPQFLRYLMRIVGVCQSAQCPVTVCGEMASHPLEGLVLAAMGFDRLSVSPGAVAGLFWSIQQINLKSLRAFLEEALAKNRPSTRNYLRLYLQDHGVQYI